MKSKKLSNQDLSGEEFTNLLFADNRFKDLFIDFDRIHFNYKDNSWVISDHLLIDKMVNNISELSSPTQNKIKKLIEFSNFAEHLSGVKFQILIDLYFPKNNKNENKVLLLEKNSLTFKELSLSKFSALFREQNFFGDEKNKNKIFSPLMVSSEDINKNRESDTPFALSKSCLFGDVTLGFNIDKIIFNNNNKKCFIFEFLLCDESQIVNPYTSHPNKYFNKNSQKFISLFNFSKLISSPLYLLNYARPSTPHSNKILFMKVLSVDPTNTKTPILTKNARTNPKHLSASICNLVFPEEITDRATKSIY